MILELAVTIEKAALAFTIFDFGTMSGSADLTAGLKKERDMPSTMPTARTIHIFRIPAKGAIKTWGMNEAAVTVVINAVDPVVTRIRNPSAIR